jgi:hypothetical protein
MGMRGEEKIYLARNYTLHGRGLTPGKEKAAGELPAAVLERSQNKGEMATGSSEGKQLPQKPSGAII